MNHWQDILQLYLKQDARPTYDKYVEYCIARGHAAAGAYLYDKYIKTARRNAA